MRMLFSSISVLGHVCLSEDLRRARGVGIALIGSDAGTDRCEAALRRVLDDPNLRHNAGRLAAEIADLPSLDDAVTALEQLS